MNWPKSLAEVVKSRAASLNDLHVRSEAGERVFTGIPTGFKSVDYEFGGLPIGVITALGADTGLGKSAFLRAFAHGAVRCDPDHYSLIFNLEDGNLNLADRVVGEQTGFGATKVRKLDYKAVDRARLEAVARVEWLNRVLVEETVYDAVAIKEEAVRVAAGLKKKGKRLALIGIDYGQLVRVKGIQNTTERIQQALLILAEMAKEAEAATVVLSQLSEKKVADRGLNHYYQAVAAKGRGEEVSTEDLYEGFAPQRGDFHWASEWDQFAKLVLAAFRIGPYRKETDGGRDEDTRVTLRTLKNNFGPCKRFTMGWDGPLTRVYDLSE